MPPEPRQQTRRRPTLSWDLAVVGVLLVVLVVASMSVSGFASTRNIGFLLLDIMVIALIALPLTLVVVTGEIDLSVASTVGLTSAVMGSLWVSGLSLELIVVLCIVLGGVLGAVNGLLVTGFGLPSLAVTIGTLALFRGLAFVVLGDRAVADFPSDWTGWAIGSIGGTGIPNAVLPLALLAVVFVVILHFTPIGRGLYAMGNNTEAAVFAGIAVRRTKFWLFVATGAVSGLGGVFWTLRFASARADNANGLELLVVAAVLLGGVSIFGGRGGLFGVLAAVLLLGSLRNALQLVNVSSDALNVLTGLLLIISVVVPSLLARRRGRRRPGGGPPSGANPVPTTAASTGGP
ncbi:MULTISPECIES: ABC transporter permease [Actinoalloteichus]|uniref:Autoinducer 2 import system permease protein LsrD n=1 Tax=Actinoalloteichus fjordicus TaxID=1612552 RepID=A0AAC9LHC4_9PSEU|nr:MULTISPECIES: ABC transporter permease [Actinoalloteichus]APU17351.1 permease component of ribose/xylose/arabinose/galactoside ABC-type transporters [Actinoalloteichus fjordicus]APU23435.1 permease component of ribose/xylose/arabinose/galactoside ABC-type transporters [Actinoalloteichus sp. GBA129-24]